MLVIVGGFAVFAGGFAVLAAVFVATLAGFGGKGVGRCWTGAVVVAAGVATFALASVVAGGTSVEIVPLDQICTRLSLLIVTMIRSLSAGASGELGVVIALPLIVSCTLAAFHRL